MASMRKPHWLCKAEGELQPTAGKLINMGKFMGNQPTHQVVILYW